MPARLLGTQCLYSPSFRCVQTIFVDKAEYQEAQEIVCPLPGCVYAWCKACSQAIEIGGPKHSCDGSSELKHLMDLRGWKHCPGNMALHFTLYAPLAHRVISYALLRMQNPCREDRRVQPYDCECRLLPETCEVS